MARRYDHSREEIKKMVVDSGHNLIKESGFSKFSTRKIAKEIGYTVGTLYNIFDGYDDIILHINAKTLDEMHNFIKKGINSELKGDKSIKQLAKLYINFAHKNHHSWGALFEYSMPQEVSSPKWYQEKVENLFAIVEGLLSKFITKKSDALKHAKVIWAGIHGICLLSLTKKIDVVGAESVELLTDSLIENYLRGIEK